MKSYVLRILWMVSAILIACTAFEFAHHHDANATCPVCLAQTGRRRKSALGLSHSKRLAILDRIQPFQSQRVQLCELPVEYIVAGFAPTVGCIMFRHDPGREILADPPWIRLGFPLNSTGPPRAPPQT